MYTNQLIRIEHDPPADETLNQSLCHINDLLTLVAKLSTYRSLSLFSPEARIVIQAQKFLEQQHTP